LEAKVNSKSNDLEYKEEKCECCKNGYYPYYIIVNGEKTGAKFCPLCGRKLHNENN
jgi:hypothetical protein